MSESLIGLTGPARDAMADLAVATMGEPPRLFLLFQGENYYPDGGASDFVAQADSIERLKVIAEISPLRSEWATAAYNVWWQIAELRDGKMIVVLNGNLPDNGLDEVSPPFAITWSEYEP